MVARWHNTFGEHGERLTILSLLPRAGTDPAGGCGDVDRRVGADPPWAGPPTGPQEEQDSPLTLVEAVGRLYRLAGEDGRAGVVLSVSAADDGSAAFDAAEDVALRDVVDDLYRSAGDVDRCLVTLSVIGPDDDPLALVGLAGDDGQAGRPDADSPGGGRRPVEALRRLRERVQRLFGVSEADGIPPTVLSLLVRPPANPDE